LRIARKTRHAHRALLLSCDCDALQRASAATRTAAAVGNLL
jgi:hypothetical protein